ILKTLNVENRTQAALVITSS
ncbi:MAG: hypothetical protein ACOY17_10995, partial [Pseudomonadota bacterium]